MLAALRSLFTPRDRDADRRAVEQDAQIARERFEAYRRVTCHTTQAMQVHCWPDAQPVEGAPCACGKTRFASHQ